MGLSIEQRRRFVVACVENHLSQLSDEELSSIAFLVYVEQQDRYQRDAIADAHTLEEGE